MDASTRAYIAKLLGSIIAIGIGVAGLTAPPLLMTGPVVSGGFITAGLIGLGVNIGATVAAGAEAAHMRAARKAATPRR